jgi:hypothetical protein
MNPQADSAYSDQTDDGRNPFGEPRFRPPPMNFWDKLDAGKLEERELQMLE